jgi:hypothetical protein
MRRWLKGWTVQISLLSRIFFGPLALIPTLVGCQTLHPIPTVPIAVVDAETKAPIPGATVRLWSPADNSPSHIEPSGTTGPDGVARIKAAFPKEADVLIEVSAPGYLSDEMDRTLSAKAPGAPAGGGLVEMFAGPKPYIQLVIPTGFRGDLKAEIKVQDDAPTQPGQRVFTYNVPLPTVENIVGTPIVVHIVAPPVIDGRLAPFRGLYANRTPMPAEPKDSDVVLRWVRSEGLDQYFVVGTKIDQESARRAAEKTIGPRESSGDSKSSGGGRRGGGGGGRGGMGGMGGMGGGASNPGGFGGN